MEPIVLYDCDQVTVWYYPDKKIIHHKMHKFVHGEHFHNALMAGAEAMEKYGAIKWLSDDTNNPVYDPADIEWGNQNWQPRVLKAGWKYWAVVRPESYLSQLRMMKLVEMYKSLGVTVELFTDAEEAMKWLEKQGE